MAWNRIEVECDRRFSMKNARFVIVAGLVLALLACASGTAEKQGTDSARGAELLSPFKQDLKQALAAGMQAGPVNAVSVCKDQAPAIAASLSVEGVQMGRTSHRLRNPENSAPAWVDTILQSYVSDGQGRAPRLVTLPNDRLGYVEPIATQPLCLVCHGKSLAPDLATHIAQAYPEDRATGFEEGDLRGVFWVEYPAAE
jgi:hypothetical protein